MSIIRINRGNYTSISRSLLQDRSVSYETRGMLAYLLSHADNWECRVSDIERNGGIGQFARRRIMKEAELAGYLTFTKSRGKDGRYVSAYMVFETPVDAKDRTRSWESGGGEPDSDETDTAEPESNEPDTSSPQPEKPPTGFRHLENRGLYIESDLQNSDLKKREREREEKLSPPSADTPVSIYQDIRGEGIPIFQQEALENANITNTPLWREVVTGWRANGYSMRNITGMINQYRERESRKEKGTDYETKRKQAAEYCHKLITNPVDIPSPEKDTDSRRSGVGQGYPAGWPNQFIKPRTFADVFEESRRARDGKPSESVV